MKKIYYILVLVLFTMVKANLDSLDISFDIEPLVDELLFPKNEDDSLKKDQLTLISK